MHGECAVDKEGGVKDSLRTEHHGNKNGTIGASYFTKSPNSLKKKRSSILLFCTKKHQWIAWEANGVKKLCYFFGFWFFSGTDKIRLKGAVPCKLVSTESSGTGVGDPDNNQYFNKCPLLALQDPYVWSWWTPEAGRGPT